MTKITYIDALNAALTCDLSDEIKEKLTALKEQLTKRNTAKSGKPTKTQRENVEVKERIRECLTHTLQGLRAGEIAKELDLSCQKVSALLKQMKDEGVVTTREGEKRTTLFLLPENDMSDPANS